MKKSIPFTKQGFEDLREKLKKLQEERPEVVSELKRAREMGDLRENGAYRGARFKLSQIDRDIVYIENLLKKGFVVEKKETSLITIGSSVVVMQNNLSQTFHIVGSYESDPLNGRISHKSPLGESLLQKKIGDEARVKTPKGETVYIILRIF